MYCYKYFPLVSGKVDSWEWDSGARDLSPVPQQLVRKAANTNFLEPMIQVRIMFSLLYKQKFWV